MLGNPLSHKKEQTHSISQAPQQDQRGTQNSPLFVKELPSPKTQAEIDQDREERQQQSSHEWWTIVISGILAVIALGQLAVYWYQAVQLRRAVESAGEQAEAMERHIGEAARSATAMEGIAKYIQDGNKAILRAYLTVTIGNALFQERREGQGDLKFEARPNLSNTGNTPARKIRIRIAADIIPVPIPDDFSFPLPDVDPSISPSGIVGAHQTSIIYATVKDFVPDSEVASIREGHEKALAVWGEVTYEDVFGESHVTKFGQSITWNPDKSIMGYYLSGNSEVT